MAGVKRKIEAPKGSATMSSGGPPSTPLNIHPRANTAAHNASAVANSSKSTTRETRASRTRAAAPAAPVASTQVDGTASSNVPETPRSKRVKRGSVAEETPRTTRQSARLRPHFHPVAGENAPSEADIAPKRPEEASPSVSIASVSRTRKRSRQTVDETKEPVYDGAPDAAITVVKVSPRSVTTAENDKETKPMDAEASRAPSAGPSQPVEEVREVPAAQKDNDEASMLAAADEAVSPTTKPTSPLAKRKRKSSEIEGPNAADPANLADSPSKKPKLEDGVQDLEQQLQGGPDAKTESQSPADGAAENKTDTESRQITEEAEGSTSEIATGPAVAKVVRPSRNRGRGRGGRSRAAARFASSKRGRGSTRSARGGRSGRQYDRSSDVELERSPSPSAATQKLRDRQRELDKAFRRLAAAQRLALAVLASQSEKKLSLDKNAHINVPEYDEISSLLKDRLRGRLEVFYREYELKVEQENRLFTANKEAIEERFRAAARNIQEEHFHASQGDYMAFVEGRRAAEDDEHTETDGSETEAERGPIIPPAKEFVRGFNSSFVQDTAGAAAYERGHAGWDDFVQRAKLGDDIDPQMKEMGNAGPFSGLSAREIIDLLLQATGIVEVRQGGAIEKQAPPVVANVRPTALSALADIAAAELPRPSISQATPRLPAHRNILPQPQVAHGPTDPRPFVLPPPTPHRQGSRRLLPAAQQIPPINEQLGLPDPFASRGGPPQLPPPPGSNFQRPPPPGYLAGHHPSPLYFPPPPPGPRPPY
ncbi:uncharacterized protein ATNIH1004_009889 [Aspergillus tanneri]|uniref:Uncharacterized protein n=1 Tax=Aspergillus tanneri TaxID=1220188 RepID=A0A5M9MJZ1_9EURO|nr:uncharacterized protein ATNIH1004_009889 [Aspergillus tanneri]KAA8643127.1 hypothetical protein ATNIH1004_009889 [Aspergillus tanneri]